MELTKNILATLAYYDVFDWPLKAGEIFTKLIKFESFSRAQSTPKESPYDPTRQVGYRLQSLNVEHWTSRFDLSNRGSSIAMQSGLNAVQIELDQLVLDQIVDCGDGSRRNRIHAAGPRGFLRDKFYFLNGREHLVPLRLKREKIAKRKWRLARRAVRWLRLVPYVRAIFASGSLAMRNTDELSDLDVLIVVKHGRIWLTRFLILAVLSLLGMRRKAGDKIAPDKICPNHFITDESLCIPFKSIYTAQTYANLAPIYVDGGTLIEEFKKANNWVLDYVSQWNIEEEGLGFWVHPALAGKGGVQGSVGFFVGNRIITKLLEKFLDILGLSRFLENWLRRYQSKRIVKSSAVHGDNGHAVFNDEQLAFHPDSIEVEIVRKYSSRLQSLVWPA